MRNYAHAEIWASEVMSSTSDRDSHWKYSVIIVAGAAKPEITDFKPKRGLHTLLLVTVIIRVPPQGGGFNIFYVPVQGVVNGKSEMLLRPCSKIQDF